MTSPDAAQEPDLPLEDRLGKLVKNLCRQLDACEDWETFVHRVRGKASISDDVRTLPHPASGLLEGYRLRGVPVVTSDTPWAASEARERVKQGPHKSAKDEVDFVREEMADFVDKGFWVVLPYSKVAHLEGLRISPLGSVPQLDRRPRLIVDLTFSGVNAATVNLVPREAMQFGRTLERLLFHIRHADPAHGPVYLSKIDIADGFYRVWLQANAAPKLAVVLPSQPGQQEPLIGIPLTLPMGWVESPPAFCAVTETAADLANSQMHHRHAPPHRLDAVADTVHPAPEPTEPGRELGATWQDRSGSTEARIEIVSPPQHRPALRVPIPRPVRYVDVYVDDFIGLAQGSQHDRTVIRRHIMHAIDRVLRPLEDQDAPASQEAMSRKKMLKGDASWSTRKTVLGWVIDTEDQTLTLPPHREARARDLFTGLKGARRVAESKWHKLLGELRSMVLAIPGGKGLFGILQTGFTHTEKSRIRIDGPIRDQLDDFECLVLDLGQRPTRLAEIVPDLPLLTGACDASGAGMGGVWFGTINQPPVLWREPFPTELQQRLVSSENRNGDVTNSDLEMAGALAHVDIAAQKWDVREHTIAVLSDNTSAVGWANRGSVTTRAPAAYLLRLASLHQRHYRYHATHSHIKGKANVMADDCSRLWHLPNTALLAHFNQEYPQPLPWNIAQLRPEMRSVVISALHRQRVAPQSYLNVPLHMTPRGSSGPPTAVTTESTPCWPESPTRFHTSSCSPSGTATGPWQRAASRSELEPWRTPYAPSVRRWPYWGPMTNGSTGTGTSTSGSPGSSKGSENGTRSRLG
jgi:hypothetical protein